MKNQEKKDYQSPRLTVVTFKVEQGFSASGVLESLMFWENEHDANNMEAYEIQDNWHSGGDFWN